MEVGLVVVLWKAWATGRVAEGVGLGEWTGKGVAGVWGGVAIEVPIQGIVRVGCARERYREGVRLWDCLGLTEFPFHMVPCG